LKIQNDIKNFFNSFIDTNRVVFSELKHSINDEQNNLINSLDELKSEVHRSFGEESLNVKISDQVSVKNEKIDMDTFGKDCDEDKKELMKRLLNNVNENNNS
jgi:hypothetical protein